MSRGELSARVAAKATPEARNLEKARIHRDHAHLNRAPWTAERDGVVYTLSLPRGVHIENRDGVFVLVVPVVRCDPPPPVPLDPPYLFVNPPILVPDDGTAGTYREDPAEALRRIVADTVLRGG